MITKFRLPSIFRERFEVQNWRKITPLETYIGPIRVSTEDTKTSNISQLVINTNFNKIPQLPRIQSVLIEGLV